MVIASIINAIPITSAFGVDYGYFSRNDIFYYDPNAVECSFTGSLTGIVSSGGLETVNHEQNIEAILRFFTGKGLPLAAAAGLTGNMLRESDVNPTAINLYDGTYGKTVSDTWVPDPSKKQAFGLIQWINPRLNLLYQYSKDTGDPNVPNAPITSIDIQLNYVWKELTVPGTADGVNFTDTVKALMGVRDDPIRAAFIVHGEGGGIHDGSDPDRQYAQNLPKFGFEASNDSATLIYKTRAIPAKNVYDKYKGIIADGDPSKINISSAGGSGGTASALSAQCNAVCPIGMTTGTVDVVLDPGHSKVDTRGTYDSATNLHVGEYWNAPEGDEMFQMAQKIEQKLKAAGYTVLITKKTADESMTLAKRADIANQANAQIAVSLHTTEGDFGGDQSMVLIQQNGGYRLDKDGNKVTFTDTALAAKSKEYGDAMVAARKKYEPETHIQVMSFDGREKYIAPGNIPMVSLLAKVPWIYNEAGQKNRNIDKYTEGTVNGIMAAIKPRGGDATATTLSSSPSNRCSGAVQGDIIKTAINYAWPQSARTLGHYTIKKPVYETAVQAAKAAGKYTGDTCFGGGVDCGAFVTRVIQDSGVDPNYGEGGDTLHQMNYMAANPQKYVEYFPKSTNDVQPGDIAVQNNGAIHHTYLYVGPGLTGTDGNGAPVPFEEPIASASQCNRAPMAGWEKPADPDYRWFHVINSSSTGVSV